MHTLRLTQLSTGKDKYKVEIALEGQNIRQSSISEFEFKLSPWDQESIRWYLEDYPLYRHDPAPAIAGRVEKRMAEIGHELFKRIFQANDDARDVWADLRRNVRNARVEIVAGVRETTAIPWELIRDPKTDTCLALQAAAFVHSNYQPSRPFIFPENNAGPIRILLVICRPEGRNDVPFRSVASRLIKGLSDADRDLFQLDVLRPATYDALAKNLRSAKDAKKQYHIVHFDGHGAFVNMDDVIGAMKKKDADLETAMKKLLAEIGINSSHKYNAAATVYPKGQREGKHGYLCFENPGNSVNLRFVDGGEIGDLLAETEVPVLVLNACRSAHAEAAEKPDDKTDEKPEADPHAQNRAFGSLAQEIVDKGTAGVVAMRYNVYVETAAQFMADLYGSLITGNPLGKAVSLGRKALFADPVRKITGDKLALQDWCVPVVYEAGPIALFQEQRTEKTLKICLSENQIIPSRGHLDPNLPVTPDAGFWGRDETLLALDRAFDDHRVVLLHAWAGSGKTAAVAEFARWYALTGGVAGPVLFTSFEHYTPLARVLDKFGQFFRHMLEQEGINWLARSDSERLGIALQIMQKIPILWIWDNVEPVAGFPAGTESVWRLEEQKELADFLRVARNTKVKILLTSRRNEEAWLNDLPVRITLPPMLMHERELMARGLAEKYNRKLRDLKAWRPLLRFTGGNPLTLTVLVGQALRDRLTIRAQAEAFVEALAKGEAAFEDEEIQGRTKSLAASLNYGFENAFSEDERRILALLYFFQGFVDVDVLRVMGNPKFKYAVTILRNQSRDTLILLLDRAAEVGLLTALGGGYYTIHPALPWFFKGLFNLFYQDDPLSEKAYVTAVSQLGDYYCIQYGEGNSNVIVYLTLEEPNLLHAWRLAIANGWWDCITSSMQGLFQLYSHTGRRTEWKRLVEDVVPIFVNPATDAPLHEKGDNWHLIMSYRMELARKELNWAEAERLQTVCVEWVRRQAAPFLEIPPEQLDKKGRNLVRTLAVAFEQLGTVQRELGSNECIDTYKNALQLSMQIDEKQEAAVCAFNLGHAYKNLPAIRDLEMSGQWYKESLELRDEKDRLGRARCLGQMGYVAIERFKETRADRKPQKEILEHINTALGYYHTALDMIPGDAVSDLAVTHHQLGVIYSNAGRIDPAVNHYNQAIRYRESEGELYTAGVARFNIAVILAQAGRIHDALDYARAALENFETFGDRAAAKIEMTQQLIAELSDLEA